MTRVPGTRAVAFAQWAQDTCRSPSHDIGSVTVTHPRSFPTIVVSLLMAACTVNAQELELAHGAELLEPFKKDLQMALKSGLEAGTAEAIQVCRLEAPGIADALSVDGIRMGRSSHKLRNPDNMAPEWVSPIIQAYLDDPSNRKPRAVALSGKRWGYAEPIIVQPLCLTCHGSELAPDVAKRISELYPEDKATGFAAGDLRGVFWVEFPETAR
jgi:hypothetical protein